jgi:transforming growth factor-beta-induced protein
MGVRRAAAGRAAIHGPNPKSPPAMTFDSLFSTSPRRRWGAPLCAGLLAVALVLAGCDSNGNGTTEPEPEPEPEPTTLADVVTTTDNLSTLAGVLSDAQVETLSDTNATFTVFAPSNTAFEAYDFSDNADLVAPVVNYHIVQGAAVTAGDLEDGDTFETVQGDTLEVSVEDGSVFVEGALVTTADVEADNGVAHVVDDVLLTNRTAAERLQVTAATETLLQAVSDAGIASAFNDADNNWTTFAPTNQAFENADLSRYSDSEVQQILQYHTLDGVTDSEALLQTLSDEGGEVSLETNQGEDLTITQVSEDSIAFNGGQAGLDLNRLDQRASNGIIHLIDGVLLPPSLEDGTVAEIVTGRNDLSTLTSALPDALAETLGDEDQEFTVFAPANPAFGAIDAGELTGNADLLNEVLTYHVVAGQGIAAGNITDGQTVTTVEGDSLTFTVSNGGVQVNGASVTTADLRGSNGVVHVIDGVLLETVDAVDRAVLTPQFSILADLVGQAGLTEALRGVGPDGEDGLTVFAPTDDAFLAALDEDGSGEIEDDEVPSNAASILQYHVLDDVFFAADVPTMETALPTLEGSDVTVVRDGNAVTLNPGAEASSVAVPNVEVENGVIHGIDTVLQIPSSN